jgi:uncharacterized membrane protein YbaN (DUF454 family)
MDWQVNGCIRADVKAKAVAGVILAVLLTVYLSDAAWKSVVVGLLASVGVAVIVRVPVAKRRDPADTRSGRTDEFHQSVDHSP